jgi:hypothetical protein
MCRLPGEKFPGKRARGRIVQRDKGVKVTEVRIRTLLRDVHHRQIQMATDCFGDLTEGHAFVIDRM